MANNDLLVQSSLPALPRTEVKQQTPAKEGSALLVSEKQQDITATSVSTDLHEIQQQSRIAALQEKVTELNDFMQNFNRDLQFTIDDTSGETIIKVIDSQTNEVVRQIPSQELLDARNAANKYRGLLFEIEV